MLDFYLQQLYCNTMTTNDNTFALKGDFLDDSFRLAKFVGEIGDDLKRLAKAFLMTGNQGMAETLYQYGIELNTADESLREIVGNETSRGLRDAQEMSATILTSCLSGMEIAKQKTE